MRHFFIYLLLSFLSSCTKNSSITTSQDLEKLYSVNHSYNKDSQVLSIHIKLGKGIHAYAPGEAIGKAVKLEVLEQNGWQKIGDASIPAGKTKKIGDINSIIIENDFMVTQALKPGNNPTTAKFYLQVCSNDTCGMPKVYDFIVK